MNLVNELQVSAENDDVSTVLRKTRRFASKLRRSDITDWLNSEQNGYTSVNGIPAYRMINISLAYNTNGYIPAGFGLVMNGIGELPSVIDLPPIGYRDSISSVLALIDKLNRSGGTIYEPIQESELSDSIRSIYNINPKFARQLTFLTKLNEVQVRAIPERIKDNILEWACALETAGVNGEGMSFSPTEKAVAHNVTFNIHNSQIGQLNNEGTNIRGNDGEV